MVAHFDSVRLATFYPKKKGGPQPHWSNINRPSCSTRNSSPFPSFHHHLTLRRLLLHFYPQCSLSYTSKSSPLSSNNVLNPPQGFSSIITSGRAYVARSLQGACALGVRGSGLPPPAQIDLRRWLNMSIRSGTRRY